MSKPVAEVRSLTKALICPNSHDRCVPQGQSSKGPGQISSQRAGSALEHGLGQTANPKEQVKPLCHCVLRLEPVQPL